MFIKKLKLENTSSVIQLLWLQFLTFNKILFKDILDKKK